MPLEIRILGPLEVVRDGTHLDPGSHKQRVLLSLLALHADEPVPVDRCLQAVWGADAPAGTRRSLHTYVSNLRRLLDPTRSGLIVHDDAGYRLTVPDWVTVDLVEFERLSSSRDPDDLEAALALWRAAPTASLDLAGSVAAVGKLHETRRSTAERLADLLLGAGRADDCVVLLGGLVDVHPFDEPLWSRYITALYVAGRQADALDACARLRRALTEDLGLDPSPHVRTLETRILRQDPLLGTFARPPTSRSGPGHPSIAVLPFETLGDPSREFVSIGLVEDITTDLSRSRDLFVVARNSTAAYRGQALDARTVAQQLGVGYLLEGSVQWWDEVARITARLVDGRTGRDLWNRRYDRQVIDLFGVRDEVVTDIVAHLSGYHGELVLAEKRRSLSEAPASLAVYERYLRGLALKHRFAPEDNRAARALFEDVLAEQPTFARAHVAVAWTWLFEVLWGWTDTPEVSGREAGRHAQRALELDEFDAEVHWLLGELHMVARDHDRTISAYRRARTLSPNMADVHANWCSTANRLGMADDGVRSMELALRLNPHHPVWYPQFHGAGLYGAGRYTESVATLRSARTHTVVSRLYLAAGLVRSGQLEDATAEVAAARATLPTISVGLLEQIESYRDPTDQAHLSEPLRAAGLPDGSPHGSGTGQANSSSSSA